MIWFLIYEWPWCLWSRLLRLLILLFAVDALSFFAISGFITEDSKHFWWFLGLSLNTSLFFWDILLIKCVMVPCVHDSKYERFLSFELFVDHVVKGSTSLIKVVKAFKIKIPVGRHRGSGLIFFPLLIVLKLSVERYVPIISWMIFLRSIIARRICVLWHL